MGSFSFSSQIPGGEIPHRENSQWLSEGGIVGEHHRSIHPVRLGIGKTSDDQSFRDPKRGQEI